MWLGSSWGCQSTNTQQHPSPQRTKHAHSQQNLFLSFHSSFITGNNLKVHWVINRGTRVNGILFSHRKGWVIVVHRGTLRTLCTRMTGWPVYLPSIYVSAGNLNSSPHNCTANSLSTESASYPLPLPSYGSNFIPQNLMHLISKVPLTMTECDFIGHQGGL